MSLLHIFVQYTAYKSALKDNCFVELSINSEYLYYNKIVLCVYVGGLTLPYILHVLSKYFALHMFYHGCWDGL